MRTKATETASWPIDRLTPHPSQARLFHETADAEFEELKEDIEKNSLRHRVEVTLPE